MSLYLSDLNEQQQNALISDLKHARKTKAVRHALEAINNGMEVSIGEIWKFEDFEVHE